MRRLVVLAASLAPLLIFAAEDASAQSPQALRGSAYPSVGAPMGRAPSSPALAGPGFRGPRVDGYRGSAGLGYRGTYYGRRGYYGGGALAAGAVLGATAAYPYYYGAPHYDYGASYYYGGAYYAEPYYAAPVSAGIGEHCRTPVRTCRLIDLAELGVGCSCRVTGGRAHGRVVP